jgi:hypothetical protein
MPKTSKSRLPRWDAAARTLWLGTIPVKQFQVPASNQEHILAAFDEQGWPDGIDDPLPPIDGVEPKQRLDDTIKRLNRSHRHRVIRFAGNGNGQGVRWQRVRKVRRQTRRKAVD